MKYILILLIPGILFANELPKDVKEVSDFITYADVQPVFINNCASCHNAKSPNMNWLNEKTAISKKEIMYQRVFIEGDMPLWFKYFNPFDRIMLRDWLKQDLNYDQLEKEK